MFIPLETFIETLPDCHQCQTKILSNLLEDLSEKALLLTKKVHYLTLKGMREKIYAYLTDIYTMQHSENWCYLIIANKWRKPSTFHVLR